MDEKFATTRTGELDLITTCHLVIDGYGHGLLAQALLGGSAAPSPGLVAAARRGLGGGAVAPFAPAEPAPAQPQSKAA